MHYFLIFDLEHRLWVHVRTASLYPKSMFEQKKNVKKIIIKHIIFEALKNCNLLHRRVFEIKHPCNLTGPSQIHFIYCKADSRAYPEAMV